MFYLLKFQILFNYKPKIKIKKKALRSEKRLNFFFPARVKEMNIFKAEQYGLGF